MTTLFERCPCWVVAGCCAWCGFVLAVPAPRPQPLPAKQRYVQGSWVNLRESAQSSARIVAQVPANTVLQQLTERDGWCAGAYAGHARLARLWRSPASPSGLQPVGRPAPHPGPGRAKMLPAPSGVAPSPNRCAPTATPCRVRPPCSCPRWPGRATRTRCQAQYPARAERDAAKKLDRARRGAAARAGNRPGPTVNPRTT